MLKRSPSKIDQAGRMGPLSVRLVEQSEVNQSYIKNERSHFQCFPKCNPGGHVKKNFCGTSYTFKVEIQREATTEIGFFDLREVIEDFFFGYAFFTVSGCHGVKPNTWPGDNVGDVINIKDLERRPIYGTRDAAILDRQIIKYPDRNSYVFSYIINPSSWECTIPMNEVPKKYRRLELRFILYKKNINDEKDFDGMATVVGKYSSDSFTSIATCTIRRRKRKGISSLDFDEELVTDIKINISKI